MEKLVFIRVTSPEGRLTPIHKNDGREPGGAPLMVKPGKASTVKMSQTTRRSITRGDLIPCNADGSAVDSWEAAVVVDPDPDTKALKIGATIVKPEVKS